MLKITEKLFFTDFGRILSQLPGFLRWKIYGLFVLIFLVAVFEVLALLSMTFTAMSVAAPHVLMKEPFLQEVLKLSPTIDELCKDPRYFTLIASLGVVVLTAIKNILTSILFWKQSLISEEISLYAGDVIISHFLHSPYLWHLTSDSNNTLMALNARAALSQLLVNILTLYTYASISIALVYILISATPLVILTILFLTAFVSAIVYYSMKKNLDASGQTAVVGATQESRTITNAMHGIREVLIYRQQPVFRQKFLDACRHGTRARAFLTMAPPIPTWILEVYGFGAIPLTTWILIHYYDADMALIAGVVTIVMLSAWRILPILNRSLSSLVIIRSVRPMAMLCLNSLEAIKNESREELPEPDPDFHFDKEIQLENVSFHYPNGIGEALQELTCRLPKGSQIGLVGLSGSGKSTLAALLSGLLTPDAGKILIDGVEPDGAQLVAYRSKVGYVPQTPYLLTGTIAENVAFSEWGKPYDPERVLEACRKAALDIVETNPAGIDYMLGDNGSGLSGGQAQRVSIARALYANPDILILDESTSALDQQTEAAIMQTINTFKQQLTTIIIAHRLTTVEQCDWIIWLENGRIKRQGEAEVILKEYRESMQQG